MTDNLPGNTSEEIVNRESKSTNVVEMEERPCNLCGSDPHSDLLTAWDWESPTPEKFDLVKCNRCGLIYVNPRPRKNGLGPYYNHDYYTHEKYEVPPYYLSSKSNTIWQIKLQMRAGIYSNFYTNDDAHAHYLYRVLGSIIFCLLRGRIVTRGRWGILGERGRLLDVGCGRGKFLFGITHDWLIGKDINCFGIDVDGEAVGNANDLGLRVVVADSDNLPFPDSHFDIITMKHSLEHVPDPSQTLKEIYRVTKPGGKLIIEVPNIDSIGFKMLKDKWAGIDAPRHLFHFTPVTLTKMLEKIEFKILALHKWRGVLCKDISLRRMQKFLDGKRLQNWQKKLKVGMLNAALQIIDYICSGEAISVKAYKPNT